MLKGKFAKPGKPVVNTEFQQVNQGNLLLALRIRLKRALSRIHVD